MDDSISRGGVEKTPRVLVSHKRPRSEDEAFNDDEYEDDGDFEEMNGGFSSRRRRRNSSTNPLLLTERQKAPSTAFNSLKILQNSSSCKKRGKKTFELVSVVCVFATPVLLGDAATTTTRTNAKV